MIIRTWDKTGTLIKSRVSASKRQKKSTISDKKYCSLLCRNRANARQPKTFNYPPQICEQCGKEYKPISTQQKYCSNSCAGKANYHRNYLTHQAYDRIRTRKTTIGYRIRDEHEKRATREAKWVWDGIGKWSWKYPDIDACVECNSTVYRHLANGVCMKCYNALRPRDEEKVAQWKRKGKGSQIKVAHEWIEKATNEEIPITPKIDNLLTNLVKIEEQRAAHIEEHRQKKH